MVIKGEVNFKSVNQEKLKAKVGDKVFPGDVVETGIESRAKIVMSDRNVINISPQTKLEIQKYENNGKDKNVEMNLLQGKVRNNVEQKYDDDKNKFLVKTPTAVAGVRGTQFVTGYDPETKITSVVTLRGAVSLAPVTVTAGAAKPVIINKGETTNMAPGSNPEAPKPMPKEDLKKIDQESSVSAAPAKQEVPKEVAKGDKKSDGKNSETKDAGNTNSASTTSESNSTKNADPKNSNTGHSTSTTADGGTPTNAETATTVANNSPNTSASADANANKNPEPKPLAVDNNRGPASLEPTSNTPSTTGAIAPAVAGTPPPAAAMQAPKMAGVGDIDPNQINQILPPTPPLNQPKPPMPALIAPPVVSTPPATVINDLIRNTNGKTHVIITPVPR